MAEGLLAEIETDLGERPVDDEVRALILGAFEEGPATRAQLTPLWLAGIEVEGFRGIGPTSRIDLHPRAGLVVISGRNGSGKSSFAEGLEVVLRGRSRRWEGRPADFGQGWRNTHHTPPARVVARFADRGGEVALTATWAGLTHSSVQIAGRDPEFCDAVRAAVELHNPMLAYGDLARRLESEPGQNYLAMTAALGLERIAAGYRRLAGRRREVEEVQDASEGERSDLLADLAASADERAKLAAEALDGGDLAQVEAAAAMEDPSASELRPIADLPEVDVSALLAARDQAKAEHAALAATAAAEARRLAELLASALAWHRPGETVPCPLCRTGTLGDGFRAEAEQELAGARARSSEVEAAEIRARDAEAAVQALSRAIGAVDFEPAVRLGLLRAEDVAALRALDGAALRGAREAARGWLTQRRDAWLPLSARLLAWLPEGRRGPERKAQIQHLTAAEEWLKTAEGRIGATRFEPIASQVAELFRTLGEGSNVALDAIKLAGKNNRRKIEMQAKVDGADARAAVGVMSQGEMNALALALFIPRATHADSPFRFMVLDDPVQALDPAKVDGLARVLDRLSQDRQVVVLTHDPRLLESLRRLKVQARIFEVQRGRNSTVTVRETRPPHEQFLDDAYAVLDADVPQEIRDVTVPTLCRYALEAVLTDAAWRRGLATRKLTHDEIADGVTRAKATRSLAALAMIGDRNSGDAVEDWLRNQIGGDAPRVYTTCNTAGGHGTNAGDLRRLVADVRTLSAQLAKRLA